MASIDIFLVPGFLGFKTVGRCPYFVDAPEALKDALAGHAVAVHALDVPPAGTLASRAARVARDVIRLRRPGATLHFVGHSTGGLDVRVLLAPEVRLPPADRPDGPPLDPAAVEAAAAATRSAISLATPHRGTPAADVFQRAGGDLVLRALGGLAAAPGIRCLLLGAIRIAGRVFTPVARICPEGALLRWLVTWFLAGDSMTLVSYVGGLERDQGATMHLGPAVSKTLDAVLVDRPGVRYVSFCTAPPPPTDVVAPAPDAEDPLLALTSQLYRVLWHVVGAGNARYPLPQEAGDAIRAFVDALPAGERQVVGPVDLEVGANDGIVPTWSQVHGEVGGVVASDHLDCVGMYPHRDRSGGWVSGWVRSGAGFDDARFAWLWGRIARVIAEAAVAPAP